MPTQLQDDGQEALFKERTGLVLDPYFSGTKIRWMLDNVDGARRQRRGGRARLRHHGQLPDLAAHRRRDAAHVTEVSNASRTLLFNLRTLDWDDELLERLEVPAALLPQVRSSSEVYGKTRGVPGLPDGIPVAGAAGDQQAALFGQACFAPGDAKCTYGTGAFLLMNTGASRWPRKAGLLTTVAWKIGDAVAYALEGSAFIAGAAVQWLRDGLGLIEQAPPRSRRWPAQVPDSGGVVFVPALAGLGAPHWRPDARGVISGITRGTTAAHLARATLEGIALQIHDLVAAMCEDTGLEPLAAFRVDGGAAANDLLMQFQADILEHGDRPPRGDRDHRAGRGLPGRPGHGGLAEPRRHHRRLGSRQALPPGHGCQRARHPPRALDAGRTDRLNVPTARPRLPVRQVVGRRVSDETHAVVIRLTPARKKLHN